MMKNKWIKYTAALILPYNIMALSTDFCPSCFDTCPTCNYSGIVVSGQIGAGQTSLYETYNNTTLPANNFRDRIGTNSAFDVVVTGGFRFALNANWLAGVEAFGIFPIPKQQFFITSSQFNSTLNQSWSTGVVGEIGVAPIKQMMFFGLLGAAWNNYQTTDTGTLATFATGSTNTVRAGVIGGFGAEQIPWYDCGIRSLHLREQYTLTGTSSLTYHATAAETLTYTEIITQTVTIGIAYMFTC